ncbi:MULTISPECIES: TetR family transcriptional regulator [Arsenicicoccus]|uniref:TetR family transcriptional regulator n=1 Tax=Arsenicicoccus TaxID=267408 RepID=UPI00257B0B4D|nr:MULTISPECIES: TetR family transcriptional regulator [Arsenicicoccus]
MTSPATSESLRDRTRRAVQQELTGAAITLFAARGFDAVTVDEIAEAAGMSRRSFFRYFASKDEVVLAKVARQGEQFVAALAERPDDEPAWTALRRMFDGAVALGDDPSQGHHASEWDKIIGSSDALRAGYLQRMQRAQGLVVEELDRREQRRGNPSWEPLTSAALVATAFAALLTAHAHAQSHGASLGRCLDAAMHAIALETQATL